MKLNKYIWLAALPIAFTACQEDALVENPTEKGISTLTCTMEGGLPDSRAQIVFGGTSTSAEYFHWNAGDEFTLFEFVDGSTVAKKFVIDETYSDENPSATAQFSTTNGLTSGNSYVAYYPSTLTADGGYMYNVSVSQEFKITENDGEEAAWKEYFQKNMYMKATGTIGSSSANTKLKFKHLCGLIRITYTNETDETITIESIRTDGHWGNQLILSSGSNEIKDELTDIEQLYLKMENVKVNPDESKDFYLLFIPPYGENPNPLTSITVGEKKTPTTYLGKGFSVTGFEAGQSYWFNVTNTGGETLEWTKELHSEEFVGTLEQYMECANFATLKAALASNIVENITLTKDIALLAPMEVNHPVMLNLNGKKLTLGEGYTPDETDAVFNITDSSNDWRGVEIVNGEIECAAGSEIQKYLFKLNGENVHFNLANINITSGGSVPDIIYADNDYVNIYSNENVDEEIAATSISTIGNVIYSETKEQRKSYSSNIDIDGTIKGNITYKGMTEGTNSLSMNLTIAKATIEGDLIFVDVNEDIDRTNFLKYSMQNVTIKDGSEGWLDEYRFAEDQEYTVSNKEELLEALSAEKILDETTRITLRKTNDEGTEEIFDISLTEPLTIEKSVNINLNGNKLSLSSNFDWKNSNAAITNTDYLYIYNGSVEGSASDEGRYMFKSSSSENLLNFRSVTLNTTGSLNAVYVDNSEFRIYDNDTSTSITVPDNCYAIYAEATSRESKVELNHTGTITGDICFALNYNNSGVNEQSRLYLGSGEVVGDLEKTGNYPNYLQIVYGKGTVDGDGWPTAVDILKQDMEADGQYWAESLNINEDVTIELDADFEDIYFGTQRLTGEGIITFKQKNESENPKQIRIYVENLSGNIDFKFDGNFIKDMTVGSDQINKVMEWADGSGRVELILTGDVTINEQLVGNDLPLKVESDSDSGRLVLNLNGNALNSTVSDSPAILWKGGELLIQNGTFNASGDAIQVGAPLSQDSHSVAAVTLMELNLTSTNGCCIYVHSYSSETATSYKQVDVNVVKNSVLTGKTASIDYNNTQYKIPDKEEKGNLNVTVDETCTLSPELNF